MDLLQQDIAHYKNLLKIICDNDTQFEILFSNYLHTIELAKQLWK